MTRPRLTHAGSLAPQAAGVIHTDFENKFGASPRCLCLTRAVCGEIFNITHLQEHGSEAAVKAKGLIRQRGKTYESAFNVPEWALTRAVQPGDIAFWKSGQ